MNSGIKTRWASIGAGAQMLLRPTARCLSQRAPPYRSDGETEAQEKVPSYESRAELAAAPHTAFLRRALAYI